MPPYLPTASKKQSLLSPDFLKSPSPSHTFGGIPPETPIQFSARVSERLRHKDRAITAWDFENLILQQFPQIRACLTLNHTSIPQGTTPGTVTTLIFPEITAAKNPLSPLADRSTLIDITNYLTTRCDPDLKLSVVNPDYLYTHITAAITPQTRQRPRTLPSGPLNQSLIQELAPWSIPDSSINPFSVSHTYDSILQYILAQPYIQTVGQLQISLVPTQAATSGGVIQQQGNSPIAPPTPLDLNQLSQPASTGHHHRTLQPDQSSKSFTQDDQPHNPSLKKQLALT